jgi:glycine/D-amino acid oxidase-like deaminating enzyme
MKSEVGVRIARAVRLPKDDRESGWIAALPAPAPARPLVGEESADCVVVGAGLTGLAIARRLAELLPGRRIVVLDAQRAGDGASGRNAGFVVDLTDFASTALTAPDQERYVRVARSGIRALREVVEQHGIDCDWDESGFVRAAAGAEGLGFLERWPALLDSLGSPYRWLDRAAVAEFLGTPFYRAGLHMPGSIQVQPAALTRGLARSLPSEVELYEESPVHAVHHDGSFRVSLSGGNVACRRLFLAINGYAPALGLLRETIFPLFTFGSMTRPLTPGEQEAIGGERCWGILAMDPMGSTIRRTRDQRILMRNTLHYDPGLAIGDELRQRVREIHRATIRTRFPALAEIELEHTWSGLMGTTRDRRLFFDQPREGLFVTAGLNGAGIAMGTAVGKLLAERACGVRSPLMEDLMHLPKPAPMPPEPLRSLSGRWWVARLNRQVGAVL